VVSFAQLKAVIILKTCVNIASRYMRYTSLSTLEVLKRSQTVARTADCTAS